MHTHAARPWTLTTAGGILTIAALLAGCGTDPSVEEFCDTSEVSAITDTGDDEYLIEVAEALSATDAPDEIADDWEIYVSGLTAFAEAVDGADPPTPEGEDAYVAARTTMMSDEFTEATARVEAFSEEHCDT